MSRSLATLLLGLLLPGNLAAQHAVGVSATILPGVTVPEPDWALVRAAGGIELQPGSSGRVDASAGTDSRILQRACVAADLPADGGTPEPAPPGGVVAITADCRLVVPPDSPGTLPGRSRPERSTRSLVITRIVAANS